MSDLISRQAAYDALTEYYHHTTETQHKSLKEALSRVPPLDVPERKAGKWEFYRSLDDWGVPILKEYGCSECRHIVGMPPQNLYRFCPNCGVKMERSKE